MWWSLAELNQLEPDAEHFASTVDNLYELRRVTENARVWRREEIQVGLIDPLQLIDDPDDHEGETKVESIRRACRLGVRLPHVVVLHEPADQEHPYFLIEGRHRYNAHHRERLRTIRAFVAHVGCCGGPAAAEVETC